MCVCMYIYIYICLLQTPALEPPSHQLSHRSECSAFRALVWFLAASANQDTTSDAQLEAQKQSFGFESIERRFPSRRHSGFKVIQKAQSGHFETCDICRVGATLGKPLKEQELTPFYFFQAARFFSKKCRRCF